MPTFDISRKVVTTVTTDLPENDLRAALDDLNDIVISATKSYLADLSTRRGRAITVDSFHLHSESVTEGSENISGDAIRKVVDITVDGVRI